MKTVNCQLTDRQRALLLGLAAERRNDLENTVKLAKATLGADNTTVGRLTDDIEAIDLTITTLRQAEAIAA